MKTREKTYKALALVALLGMVGNLGSTFAAAAPAVETPIADPVAAPPENLVPTSPAPASAPAAPKSPTSLEVQLEALNLPANQAPMGVDTERLYAVQNRYVSLRNRHELAVGGGKNFNTDGGLVSSNLDLSYRYYLNDRWFLGASGSYVFNDWAGLALRTMQDDQQNGVASRVPDVSLTKYRGDLLVGYQLFYGKFRLTMDQVFYFDQYIAAGAGYLSSQYVVEGSGGGLNMVTYSGVAAVGELGFSFWFGKNFSMRLGVKDYFVREVRNKGTEMVHNLIGLFQVGYVFGG